jgi:hypothetical protein
LLFTEGAQGFGPAKNASNCQVFSVVGGLRGDLLGHDLACIGIVARAKVRRCPARQRNRDRKAAQEISLMNLHDGAGRLTKRRLSIIDFTNLVALV